MNEQYKHNDELINSTYSVLGGLDNIKTLMYYISDELDNYTRIEAIERCTAKILVDSITRVIQLTYIFDNEFEHTMQALETIRKQIEA